MTAVPHVLGSGPHVGAVEPAPATAGAHVIPGAVPAGANPWRPLGPCTPAACVRAPAAAAGPCLRAARIVAASLVVLAGVPVALACRAASLPVRARATGAWARLLLHVLGIRLDVTAEAVGGGTRPAGDARAGAGGSRLLGAGGAGGGGVAERGEAGTLVVANHVSWLDPLVLAAVVPSRPLAKREVGRWPVVRTLVAGAGALLIERDRLSALPQAVAAVAGALAGGDTVIAFPEGTTWCGRGMGRFRPAVFQAAIDAGATVRPVALRYREGPALSTRASFVGDDPLLASVLRVATTRGLVAEVRLLTPVRPAHAAPRTRARAELARIAEARVRAGLRARYGDRPRGEGV
ncbi:1-acyl-sn-glycerol-3-phosphate acyltransferase [Nonomuraea terrae]|uniref:1-acyl-sn-glycerol-3-phosphate acyltransferase n=1 Tax=Nonomuraea terrae TaxID=2530383 RepID=A0A4R4Y7J5_9ACTN|nr:lysophospholipid acyltransferase family protein [Nonomuraea terrae]TDD40401.1 1-acyl-sn-glycerol-3-phosphate acyltransferase [Nonomuraea terrae]